MHTSGRQKLKAVNMEVKNDKNTVTRRSITSSNYSRRKTQCAHSFLKGRQVFRVFLDVKRVQSTTSFCC